MQARHDIAKNGAAQMSNMHLLGHIHAAQIHNNGVRARRGFNAKVGHAHAVKHGVKRGIAKANIDEAGAGNFRGSQRRKRSGRENLCGNVAWIGADGTRNGKRRVALKVSVLVVVARFDLRIALGGLIADRRCNALAEGLFKIKFWIA